MSNPQTFADGYPLGPRHISRPPASHLAGHTGNTPRTNTPVKQSQRQKPPWVCLKNVTGNPLKSHGSLLHCFPFNNCPKTVNPLVDHVSFMAIHSTATSIFQTKRATVALPHRYPWDFSPHHMALAWLLCPSALRPPRERQVRQQWLRHVATGGRRWSGEFLPTIQAGNHAIPPLIGAPWMNGQKKVGKNTFWAMDSCGGWCQTIATWFWPWWYTKTPMRRKTHEAKPCGLQCLKTSPPRNHSVLQFWAHLNDHILDQEVVS